MPIAFSTIIGFIGMLLIINPNFNGISFLNIAIGIFSGFNMAVTFVTLKYLRPYFDNQFLILAIDTGTALIGGVGMFIPLEGLGGAVIPNLWQRLLIFGMGVTGTSRSIF